ncbi:type II toxin-antitoxin system antitoxin SocA domain-containing protein [Ignavibacterium album]|uniref:type II toxin-antitoxin system antitoxin SocA domain-containing protein n=1 Tax=Ignavibacterium album TaxID=591197 RepID=UPI0035B73894
MANKIKAFEYLVIKLSEWYKELNNNISFENNDLNKLKVLKLHFFVSAVNANENKEGLLNIFDNFYAMPYGHVESDVYSQISQLESMKIDRKGLAFTKCLDNNYFDDIKKIIPEIDQSIINLRTINNDLINYKALDLVNLSHRWYSWRLVFNYAKQNGSFSAPIPTELIRREPKIFHLELIN